MKYIIYLEAAGENYTRRDHVVIATGQFNLDELDIASSPHASKIKEVYPMRKAGTLVRELNTQGSRSQSSYSQMGSGGGSGHA